MSTITTRAGKGSPLTNTEVDSNFTNLNNDKLESSAYTAADVLAKVKTVDGTGSGLDADTLDGLQATAFATAAQGATADAALPNVGTRPTIRPSLLLDFANSKTVDERITFTRSTTATYYDAQGVLKYAQPDQPRIDHDPATGECKGLLIEEQRTNLLRYSSEFDNNTVWSMYDGGVVTANQTVSPDGTLSADLWTSGGTNSIVLQNASGLTAGANVSFSIYLKRGNTDWTFVRCSRTNGSTYGEFGSYFNIASGAVGSAYNSGTGILTSASIQAVGNGWYRCTVIGYNPGGTTGYGCYATAAVGNSAGTASGLTVFIWGAQLENASFPTSYIPSTTTFTSRASSATYFDSTGVLRTAGVNQPRYGYGYDSASGKWVSQGLVLESSATNYAPLSNAFASWSEQGNGDTYASLNAGSSIDGGSNACLIYKKAKAGYGFFRHLALAFSSYPVPLTFSIYVKRNNYDYVGLRLAGSPLPSGSGGGTHATFSFATGTFTSVPSDYKTSVQNCGGGWYRLSVTRSSITSETTFYYGVALCDYGGAENWDSTALGVVSVYAYGAQLETGYVATSYIPTYGSTATRAADVSSSAATTRVADAANMTGANFSSWYNYAEGSVYSESTVYSVAPTYAGIFCISAGSDNPSIQTFRQYGGIRSEVYHAPKNGVDITLSSYTTALVKTGIALASNSTAVSVNGSSPTVDSTVDVPQSVNRLGLGVLNGSGATMNGHIKKISYYPKRLSNTELQALTA